MPWRLPFCLFNRHRVDPSSVRWNGTRHVGICPDCKRTVRKSGRGYWKQLVEEKAMSKQQFDGN